MSNLKTYAGSCHCGDVQYLVKLALPPDHDRTKEAVRIYKCNCTTCLKMGFFHCRPTRPAENYILTSPSDPKELGDYRCFAKECGWYFCKKCGVRVLGLRASWEQVELDVEEWAGRKKEGEERKVQKVWKASGAERVIEVEGKEVKAPFYLSVNAVTLEPDGDVDMKMWHEKGWIHYVESRRDDGTPYRLGQPHECGMY
ncbi:hypothetical protein IQ06DRAFT_288840 [Phaeosphaeriaceae sp. SRC1lsM3a]|nr:hypothetical protein IQ06DRAFT_288840 [Stagonospora sp. SRC1lsM3a]